MLDGLEEFGADLFASSCDFVLRDPDVGAAEIDAVEFFGVGEDGRVAALANIGDDACGDALGFQVALVASAEEVFFHDGSEFKDAHQSTILFKGYSTMP